MGKKIVWLGVSCLMALSLVMASCGPAAVEEEEEEEEVVIGEEEEEEEVIQEGFRSPEEPKYGGIITSAISTDPNGFDVGVVMSILTSTIYFTHDKLIRGDWGKGPAGTGDTNWLGWCLCSWDNFGPSVAESWETPDGETIVFHIRKGCHWWDRAPVNGREITADDVVYSINRQWNSPTAFHQVAWGAVNIPKSVKALDKYTVEIKVDPKMQGMHLNQTGAFLYLEPPELVEVYGNWNDWENIVASGPWMTSDYVVGSAITFERNPNYWAYDPNHPENQLPYADIFKRLIIPDSSTRLAALRTGKIDYLQALSWDDYNLLHSQHPELESQNIYGNTTMLVPRVDKPELPWADVRVRQAMNLALNQPEILEDYYEGQGELLSWPWYAWKEHKKVYIPLDELPQIVQDMFEYHPDKAKQLLAEAGYPDGFKTEIVCNSTQTDILSICKEQLAQVGIDMQLKVLEPGVYNSFLRGRKHDQMIVTGGKMHFLPWFMYEIRKEAFDNCAFYENPKTRAVYEEVQWTVMKDPDETWRLLKEITPFMLEECVIGGMLPVPYVYDMWWPWLQNWFAATRIGQWEPETNVRYAWIDMEMKRAMGY